MAGTLSTSSSAALAEELGRGGRRDAQDRDAPGDGDRRFAAGAPTTALAPDEDDEFAFGLDRILDGVEALIRRER